MKKLRLLIITILLIAAGGWFYLANKFEQIVENDIISKLNHENSLITADLDSLLIEKFKFKVTLKDVVILPNVPHLRLVSDQVIMTYNPLADRLSAKFGGKKLTGGKDKTEFYIPSPDEVIEFNRGLLQKSYDTIDIVIKSQEPSIYFASNDQFITRANMAKASFSSKLGKDGMYDIKFALEADKMDINPESKYMLFVLDSMFPELANNDSLSDAHLDLYNYYFQVANKTGPTNYNTAYSARIGKTHMDNFVSVLNGEKELTDVVKEFSFTTDHYSLSGQESFKNAAINDYSTFYIAGDAVNIKGDFDLSMNRDFNEDQQQKVMKVIQDVLLKTANNFLGEAKETANLSSNDFSLLANDFIDLKQASLSFSANYNIESSDIDQALKLNVGEFSAQLNGSVNDKIYEGKAVISTPRNLIDGITNIHFKDIKPLLAKAYPENPKFIVDQNQIITNVKENGLSALSTFHENEELKEGDSLVINLMLNPSKFDFQINGNDVFDILTDKRVVKFLNDMPDKDMPDKKTDKKNNIQE